MRAIANFNIKEVFYWVVRIWQEVILIFESFSKPKATFCKYWKSTEIKINVILVYKDYKGKIKNGTAAIIAGTKIKMKFLLV